MTEPVLIWGAGAIGGILGAYWARAGVPVKMVDIVEEHAQLCSTTGLAIEGPVETFTQVVDCVTPDKLTGTYSRVVLAVKAQATEAAAAQLAPHLAPDGYVLSAQNGLACDSLSLEQVQRMDHQARDIARHIMADLPR